MIFGYVLWVSYVDCEETGDQQERDRDCMHNPEVPTLTCMHAQSIQLDQVKAFKEVPKALRSNIVVPLNFQPKYIRRYYFDRIYF